MSSLPLNLSLHPILGQRTPADDGCFEHGYRLRLPNGPALSMDDPLLAAFGARAEWLRVDDEHDEALQSAGFDPGRLVELETDPLDPDDPGAVSVWDAERLRNAGRLPSPAAAIVAAGREAGLRYRGLVLSELRAAADDRREHLCLLAFAPALVRPRVPRRARRRPPRPARPRLVLVADGSGDVRWWDPSATSGPIAAGDLPLSDELRRDLERLRNDFAAHAAADEGGRRALERIEADWERERLQTTAAELWRRARAELSRRYAVGFLGEGMQRPVWSSRELCEDCDDELPF